MNTYKFIDHTADICAAVNAESIEALFETAADAWRFSVFEDRLLTKSMDQSFTFKTESLEELLVEFLSELNFYLYTRKMLYGKVKNLRINEENDLFRLKVKVSMNEIELDKIDLKEEIKAVTFHNLRIIEKDNRLYTKIVFDI